MFYYKFSVIDEWLINNLYYNILFFSESSNLNDSTEFSLKLINDLHFSSLDRLELCNSIVGYAERFFDKDKAACQRILDKAKEIRDKSEDDFNVIEKKLSIDEYVGLKVLGCLGEIYKTSSFTTVETVGNPIMWGHYAEKCAGVCIGYDIEKLEPKEIKYIESKEVPLVKLSCIKNENFNQIMGQIITKKHKDWSYENEYRVIRFEGDTLELESDQVKEVIFGYKANPKKAKLIRDIVRKSNPGVEIYMAIPSKNNYQMVKVKLEDDESMEDYLSYAGSNNLGEEYILDHSIAKKQ